jgi:glyoxylase I family protein
MAIAVRNFSHLCISVSDVDRSLLFYRDALGLEVVFDKRLDGPGMEAATGESGARGRMVGLCVPGPGNITLELLGFGHRDPAAARQRAPFGVTNLSLNVDDLDAAYAQTLAVGLKPVQEPFEVGGVRMFFLTDPDGTAVELVEFPGDATTATEFNR